MSRAVIDPIPRYRHQPRRVYNSSRARVATLLSSPSIFSSRSSIRSSSSLPSSTTASGRAASPSSSTPTSCVILALPCGATTPNSARGPRRALMVCVRADAPAGHACERASLAPAALRLPSSEEGALRSSSFLLLVPSCNSLPRPTLSIFSLRVSLLLAERGFLFHLVLSIPPYMPVHTVRAKPRKGRTNVECSKAPDHYRTEPPSDHSAPTPRTRWAPCKLRARQSRRAYGRCAQGERVAERKPLCSRTNPLTRNPDYNPRPHPQRWRGHLLFVPYAHDCGPVV